MVSLEGSLATAQELDRLGLRVIPAKFQDKAPLVDWKKYQTTPTTSMLSQWFSKGRTYNYWVMTGLASRIIVIDADNAAGDAWWRSQLGNELLDATTKVKTSKGYHYYFRIPDDWDKPVSSWSVHDRNDPDAESFDVRADGTGVIAPPSIHESGHKYVWETPFDQMQDAPEKLLDGGYRRIAPTSSRETTTDTGGTARSLLAALLAAPPAAGGRNDWLARVAGHYARHYRTMQDLYEFHCEQANAMLTQPLDEAEFRKTIDSIWKAEQENHEERRLDADNGWLTSGNTCLLTQVVIKGQDGERNYDVAEYADFDLVAKGVQVEEDGKRTYWVTIRRKSRTRMGHIDEFDAILPGSTLGDDRGLRKWLAAFACTVIAPENLFPRTGTPGIRIQRYLESQRPGAIRIVPALGWDDAALEGAGGFVTHDGVLTCAGLVGIDEAGVRPDPALLAGGIAPHAYGTAGDGFEAKRVLDEVLSFHDSTVTSVFGAWWAACLLKPIIEKRTALFPFVAIEAPSESGKTNGFFEMMTQLNGSTKGETVPTYAALRDMASAHKNGIVWIDDLDDPAHLMELLRAATSGGTMTKMGEDRTSVVNRTIVAPIVLSGEALGMGSQKALLDRAVLLKVGSPTGRMSRHRPGRPQWDDVVALRDQYPGGLSALAGWYVIDALSMVDQTVDAVKSLKQGTGRAGDKVGILRAGARLLDALLARDDAAYDLAWEGGGEHARRVDEWVASDEQQSIAQNENSLTLEVLPWAIRHFQFPDHQRGPDGLPNPVFIEGSAGGDAQRLAKVILSGEKELTIWLNTALLAEAWEIRKRGRVSERTQSETALRDQGDLVATGKASRKKVNKSTVLWYRPITGDLAQTIMDRARRG